MENTVAQDNVSCNFNFNLLRHCETIYKRSVQLRNKKILSSFISVDNLLELKNKNIIKHNWFTMTDVNNANGLMKTKNENRQPVPVSSAGKHVTSVKGGKHVTSVKGGKTCNQCQARENM